MRKMICVLLALLLTASCALADAASGADTETQLAEIAMELSGQAAKLFDSDTYLGLFLAGNSESMEMASKIGSGWAVPENLCRTALLIVPETLLDEGIEQAVAAGLVSESDAEIAKLIVPSIPGWISNSLNGREGITWLALTSVISSGTVRLIPGAEPCLAWVLLDFGSEHPMMLSSFHIAEGGAASAGAKPVAYSEETASVLELIASAGLEGITEQIAPALTEELPPETGFLQELAGRVILKVY